MKNFMDKVKDHCTIGLSQNMNSQQKLTKENNLAPILRNIKFGKTLYAFSKRHYEKLHIT